jgi:hypothetical protein
MPYIHWEAEPELDKLQIAINKYKDVPTREARKTRGREILSSVASFFFTLGIKARNTENNKAEGKLEKHKSSDEKLIRRFLTSDPPLHIRQTLDQFHYYMTEDTSARDADQVIGRYFSMKFPKKPVPIMMVDQLWLWIVNGGNSSIQFLKESACKFLQTPLSPVFLNARASTSKTSMQRKR